MTRFELASRLSRGLALLEEEEKHNVINMYISDVNRQIENGESEADAVAKLGDVELLINNILKSYNLEVPRQEELHTENMEQAETPAEGISEAKEKATDKYNELKDKFINRTKKKETDFENINKEKDRLLKAGKINSVTGFFKGLWRAGANFTFTVTNLFIFMFIWMPCMAITARGIVTTAALTVMYIFTGIGFTGICIAGLGCCIVGVSFCIWLGGAISRGKKYE